MRGAYHVDVSHALVDVKDVRREMMLPHRHVADWVVASLVQTQV